MCCSVFFVVLQIILLIMFTMFTMYLWEESSVGGVCSCCLFGRRCDVWDGVCVYVQVMLWFVCVGCLVMGSAWVFVCVL